MAEKFLKQTYSDFYHPKWGAVQTISSDGEFEIVFSDGSAVWGADGPSKWGHTCGNFFYLEGNHPHGGSKKYLQEVTVLPTNGFLNRLKKHVIGVMDY